MKVFTDGSALGNPGPGGWGWWQSNSSWAAGSELVNDEGWTPQRTTNNRMELAAVIKALEAFPEGELTIVTDSKYAIDCATTWLPGWKRRGWKNSKGEPVKNRDLIETIDRLLSSRQAPATFEWIKGHAGHAGNEAADDSARGIAEAIKHGTAANRGPGRATA